MTNIMLKKEKELKKLMDMKLAKCVFSSPFILWTTISLQYFETQEVRTNLKVFLVGSCRTKTTY